MITSSVVICAYTMARWEDLRDAVDSVASGTHRPEQVVVVIDHNEVLLSRARHHFADGHSGLDVRVVPNGHGRGLSGARNTAVEIATEEVVAFLDDDAAAEPDWLESLLAHYEDPRVFGSGGSAIPVWPTATGSRRPATLPAATPNGRGELDWIVGCTYNGQPDSPVAVRNLMGCNMSFRRSVVGSIGGFSEDLGRIGKTPLGGEETEFCIRVRQRNPDALIIFEPRAMVHHRVSPDRARWKYLISRCYSEGLSKAVVARLVGRDAALESERRYVSQVLGRAFLRELARAGRGQRAGATGAAAILVGLGVTTAGYIRGSASSIRDVRVKRYPMSSVAA